jgi:hypothetical protein
MSSNMAFMSFSFTSWFEGKKRPLEIGHKVSANPTDRGQTAKLSLTWRL